MKKIYSILPSLLIILAACSADEKGPNDGSQETQKANSDNIQDNFFNTLSALCGKSFAGSLVSNDALDKAMAGKDMRISITNCSDTRIDIPFHIERQKDIWDRSRTWVITRTNDGLRLKHDHRHQDGSEDKVTQYGGDTANAGTATVQNFPVDQQSIKIFNENGLTTSSTNVWSVGITDDIYSYQMERVNRKFRVEFDLTKEVKAPPPAWGHEKSYD